MIFVVDSSDKERIEGDARSAAGELAKLLEDDDLRNVPLLVLANKSDLPGGRKKNKKKQQQYAEQSHAPCVALLNFLLY